MENNVAAEQLIIRPNPARDIISVENIKIENDYIYTISDITGKAFNKESFLKKEIDISDLTSGIYIIRVENKNETRFAKFVKMK